VLQHRDDRSWHTERVARRSQCAIEIALDPQRIREITERLKGLGGETSVNRETGSASEVRGGGTAVDEPSSNSSVGICISGLSAATVALGAVGRTAAATTFDAIEAADFGRRHHHLARKRRG